MSTATKEDAGLKNGDAPPEKQETGKSDDKLIGNRKVRTILICAALLGFSIFAAGYLLLVVEKATDLNDNCKQCISNPLTGECVPLFDCDQTAALLNGANFIVSGLFFLMIFSIVVGILVCIPSCDPNKSCSARLPALGLVLGAVLYIGGWTYFVIVHKDIYYELLTDDQKENQDAMYWSWFGEAILFGGQASLLAIDIIIPHRFLMEDEFKRLFLNLTLLGGCSVCTMPAYFILSGIDDNSFVAGPTGLAFGNEGTLLIALGYLVIFLVCLVYIIATFASCCTAKDWKDTCCFRAVFSIALCVGGVLAAAGYWYYSGEGLGDDGDQAKGVAYYVGYTGLIGGLCLIWALDIAWDDIKNSRGPQK